MIILLWTPKVLLYTTHIVITRSYRRREEDDREKNNIDVKICKNGRGKAFLC
jgi:hypothetical protein